MPSSRGSSWPRDLHTSLMSPALAGGLFTTYASWEALCAVSSQHLNTAKLSIPIWIANLKVLEATAILGLIPWWCQLAGSELQQPQDRACALQVTTPLNPKCMDCLRVRILPACALMSQGQSVFRIVILGLLKVIPIGKIMQGNCVCHLSNQLKLTRNWCSQQGGAITRFVLKCHWISFFVKPIILIYLNASAFIRAVSTRKYWLH